MAGVLLTGCGDSGDATTAASGGTVTAPGSDSTDSTDADGPSPGQPDVADADAGDVEVITAWIGALSEGDVEAAAGYFATPSLAENGPIVVRIRKPADAVAFNETLPCGAEVVAAKTTGDFTTATFELTDRPGGDCGAGTGGLAATSFQIEDGKITEWHRVGPGGGGAPAPDSDTV